MLFWLIVLRMAAACLNTNEINHPGSSNTMSNAHQRILESAIGVFAEYGYAGASTREIAQRANVHQPAIAYHFNNKEQLWKDAVSFMWNDFLDNLKLHMQDQANLNDEQRIEQFSSFYVRHIANSPESVMLVVQEGAQTDDRGHWFNNTWIAPTAKVMYESLTGKKWRNNKSRQLHAVSLLSILTGSTLIFSQRSQIQSILSIDTTSPEFVDEHIKTVTIALNALLLNKT
jgi:TetR/AcrR family transcriptional regulator